MLLKSKGTPEYYQTKTQKNEGKSITVSAGYLMGFVCYKILEVMHYHHLKCANYSTRHQPVVSLCDNH